MKKILKWILKYIVMFALGFALCLLFFYKDGVMSILAHVLGVTIAAFVCDLFLTLKKK
ncbi:MAG: hypothetical protein IJ370_00550 [Oscillospiraceae bacterium]|nr:hypothetical protein [Oscillospiraceae bacterium]